MRMGDRQAGRGAEPELLSFISLVLIPITWELTSSRSESVCCPMVPEICFSLDEGQTPHFSQVLESHSPQIVSSSRRRDSAPSAQVLQESGQRLLRKQWCRAHFHRIMESLRLEKSSKNIKSNC